MLSQGEDRPGQNWMVLILETLNRMGLTF